MSDGARELADELERDYPAVDVTSVVFSRDFAGLGCCVIPQDRVLAIIAALRATPPAPMTADIAQIISQGYASGKTAAEIAEEVAREFDRPSLSGRESSLDQINELGGWIEHGLCYGVSSKDARTAARLLLQKFEIRPADPARSNGDEGITPAKRYNEFTTILDSDFESLLADRRELTSLREKLSTAEATYLQFCKKHDEKMEKAKEALEACRTAHCGYAITKDEQYPKVVDSFWKELSRIDGIARAALKEISN